MRDDPLSHTRHGKTLAFAAVVEAGTGLALLLDPALVAALLLGADLGGVAAVLGRCFGVALLALAIACWPGPRQPADSAPARRAMGAYNALIALYLAYLSVAQLFWGVLLWPAVALHAGVALLLAWPAREAQ